MSRRTRPQSLRHAEARIWTGSLAHLLGGSLDVLGALWHALRQRRARPSRGTSAAS
ncbi:MAG: hypothetical protein ACLQBB_12125 [Solirubrobacteraceae bacterium]